jgi:hypothetical protein
MESEVVRALCALASFTLPLGLAWFIVSRNEKQKGAGTVAVNSRPTTNRLKENK